MLCSREHSMLCESGERVLIPGIRRVGGRVHPVPQADCSNRPRRIMDKARSRSRVLPDVTGSCRNRDDRDRILGAGIPTRSCASLETCCSVPPVRNRDRHRRCRPEKPKRQNPGHANACGAGTGRPQKERIRSAPKAGFWRTAVAANAPLRLCISMSDSCSVGRARMQLFPTALAGCWRRDAGRRNAA